MSPRSKRRQKHTQDFTMNDHFSFFIPIRRRVVYCHCNPRIVLLLVFLQSGKIKTQHTREFSFVLNKELSWELLLMSSELDSAKTSKRSKTVDSRKESTRKQFKDNTAMMLVNPDIQKKNIIKANKGIMPCLRP